MKSEQNRQFSPVSSHRLLASCASESSQVIQSLQLAVRKASKRNHLEEHSHSGCCSDLPLFPWHGAECPRAAQGLVALQLFFTKKGVGITKPQHVFWSQQVLTGKAIVHVACGVPGARASTGCGGQSFEVHTMSSEFIAR